MRIVAEDDTFAAPLGQVAAAPVQEHRAVFRLAEQFFAVRPAPIGEAKVITVGSHDAGVNKFPIGRPITLPDAHGPVLSAEPEHGDGVFGQSNRLHGVLLPAC
jgi:hypothetical protein